MTPERLLASQPAQVVPWLEIQKRVSPDRGADLPRSFEKMRRMWLDYEIPALDLARISARTLVMAGDRDMIPVAHTVEIWSAIPGAELCIVPGADHFWLLEKPALAIRTLLAFLLGHRA
ncbi:MAG: alpha/beta fold hydrolase [Myxococcota bacterium]